LAWTLAGLDACGGAVVRPAELGGPCKRDGDCQVGLHCTFRGFEGLCNDEGALCSDACSNGLTCAALFGATQSTCWHLPRRVGDSCDDTRAQCGPGLSCYGITTRSCVELDSFRGQPCAGDWQCPQELGCVYGADGGACTDPATGTAAVDVDCSSRQCPAGLVCNQGFDPPRCRLAGGSGDVCFRGAEVGMPGADCADPLVCNWALSKRVGSGLCAQPGAAGAACARDEECGAGLACARADGGDARCE
jgi:hypothetical protein